MSEDETSQKPNKDQRIDIKAHNGKKVTKFLLSPNNKYAATWSEEDKSICGWRLDKYQPNVETNQDQFTTSQPPTAQPFKFDCSMDSIDVKEFKEFHDTSTELSAVSNNKLVAIKNFLSPNSLAVFNLTTKKRINMKIHRENIIKYYFIDCKFCNNGNFVTSTKIAIGRDKITFRPYYWNYKIIKFLFKNLHNENWRTDYLIDCGTSEDIQTCHITDKEKIILIDNCNSLTQFSLNTFSFENQYQLRWGICVKKYIFNKNLTLLAVYSEMAHSEMETLVIISVYLTENAMLLSECECKKDKNKNKTLLDLKFISFDEGERLLLFFDDDYLEIRDPYKLKYVKNDKTVSSLFEELSKLNETTLIELNMNKAEFETLIDEKIYSILNGCPSVQEITKQQWIKYIREKLRDDNKIFALPSKSEIENILQEIINKNKDKNVFDPISNIKEDKSYDGKLVKWEINSCGKVIRALKFDLSINDWKSVDNEWNFDLVKVYSCNLMNNEDLAIITSIGFLILSIWLKDLKDEIRLRYYKEFLYQNEIATHNEIATFTKLRRDDKGFKFKFFKEFPNSDEISSFTKLRHTEDFISKMQIYEDQNEIEKFTTLIHIKNLYHIIRTHKRNSLPAPDFDLIIADQNTLMNRRYPFKELLDDYSEDDITMALYGQELLKCYLKDKNYLMAEKLCNKILKKTDDDDFLSNIKLLNIITFSFIELTQFPQLLKKFLSHTSFILCTNKETAIEKLPFKSHLQSHIKYSRPFFINSIKLFISDIKNFFMTFNNTFSKKTDMVQTVILIFPLPEFNSYPSNYSFWKELIFPYPSLFAKHQFPELYKYWHVATIEELPNYTQNQLLISTIILGILHLTFEIRQFIYSPLSWFADIWNYFGAMLFPVLTSIDWLQSSTTPVWAVTISTLLLEFKFITFFRAIEFGGTYW
ncbi:99_t:CDS:2, partial [Scutellospora calospora]